MKEILMIHEIDDSIFSRIDLEKYTLTFDDGLATQWKYFDEIKKINTEKYFFISSGIVCPENVEQNFEFIPCGDAHRQFFETKVADHYMKWSQVKEILQTPDCFVGGHGHAHIRFSQITNRFERMKLMNADVLLMIEMFKTNLNYIPEVFCFPYNLTDVFYIQLLIKYGFKKLFGRERINANILGL